MLRLMITVVVSSYTVDDNLISACQVCNVLFFMSVRRWFVLYRHFVGIIPFYRILSTCGVVFLLLIPCHPLGSVKK